MEDGEERIRREDDRTAGHSPPHVPHNTQFRISVHGYCRRSPSFTTASCRILFFAAFGRVMKLSSGSHYGRINNVNLNLENKCAR